MKMQDSYKIPRHKVFVSYHHANDQFYANRLMKGLYERNPETGFMQSIFEDCSVHNGDIDDALSAEGIRKKIRDDFISDASVLILLCGSETKNRKYIDWEIHAAMFDTEKNPKLGILVVNLPTINQWLYAPDEDDKELVVPGNHQTSWTKLDSRQALTECYPYLPNRIIDNMESGIESPDIIPIAVVDWGVIEKDIAKFKMLIDKAFKRSKDKKRHYNFSAPLRRKNS